MPEGDAVLWRLSAELVCLYSDILDANKSCSVKHNAESPEAMSAVILACIQTGNCKLRWAIISEGSSSFSSVPHLGNPTKQNHGMATPLQATSKLLKKGKLQRKGGALSLVVSKFRATISFDIV
ncbi:hypothetical protein HPP92_028090 [Vanilla planifolia]|uniref:Uncharacterized protein n=1 Tax=Vanilla planifolia TaxID=51239 RepID=A0A835PA47_VANPL|nr:hypothetical protein HPP92_028090 [Vanilla planifolia]KAG0447992.1 hypothetical protein HPP92_028067 [Vanilla planifolia]